MIPDERAFFALALFDSALYFLMNLLISLCISSEFPHDLLTNAIRPAFFMVEVPSQAVLKEGRSSADARRNLARIAPNFATCPIMLSPFSNIGHYLTSANRSET